MDFLGSVKHFLVCQCRHFVDKVFCWFYHGNYIVIGKTKKVIIVSCDAHLKKFSEKTTCLFGKYACLYIVQAELSDSTIMAMCAYVVGNQ